jgi:HAD superfamily hydrolase (TIGR01484 family)
MAESGDSKTKIDAGAKARLDKALAKKYKAVVFDFDNTIASNSSADGSILRKIVELLRRGIHVGIVSGKGGALKKLLIDRLGFMLGADKDALKYFHVYVHNGASGYNAFTNEKYYNSEFAYSDLYKMGRLIAEKFKYADQIGHFEIGEEIMYTKLVPSANIDQTTITLALNLFFKAEDLPFVAVTSKLTIDITSRESDKGRAVRDLSERFGIPIDEIVKLGDQGQKGGNDHSMLIGEGAFSVDEYDQDTKQVPVKSAIGLKCVNAAKWLFENIKFEPKDSAADKKLPAIDELLDKLETSVRQEKDIEAEITNAGSYAQRVRNTKRLQLAIPADVLKDTADIGIALKKMRMLGNGETIFELIIYGLDNEIDGDKFIQLLKLPSNVRVYSVTKDEIYPEMEISSIKSIINKKYPVSSDDKLLILKDAASNEEAERIKKEIGLMPEEEKNTRIGIVVKPIDNISGISLSKILSEMLSDFGKYEHKAIKIILPVVLSSAEVKKQIEQDISALWNLLQSA